MSIDEKQEASEAAVETIEKVGGPFVSAIENTRMPTVFVDPHLPGNPIVFANDAFLRLTGYEREEVLGQSCQILMGKENGPNVQGHIQTALNDGFEGSPDARYFRKDGGEFWASMFIGPVLSDGGRVVHHYISFIDVSLRKKSEMMLDELDHRVKNVLMTVQSIVAATLRKPEVQEERVLLEGRLFALAKTHSLLARKKWENAGLRDLVEQVLGPFASGDGEEGRISFAGPEIALKPESAQNLGLMFQELATNATKYGALKAGQGRIEVSWEKLATGESLKVRWREIGGPPVSPPKSKGFGSRLIERVLSHELYSTARLDFHRDGLVCEIEVPLLTARSA